MSVTGLCEICQQSAANARCDRCGSIVCHRHHNDTTGYCTDCSGVDRPDRRF